MVELIRFQKKHVEETEEFKKVNFIAENLSKFLNDPQTLEQIFLANIPKASSGTVQNCILAVARELGFKDEAKGLFST